jgi:hypothetical protein
VVACKLHITAHEQEIFDVRLEGRHLGYTEGLKDGRDSERRSLENQVRRCVDLELAQRPCKHVRLVDERGRQLVMVALGGSAYTYSWTGDGQLKVGDNVMVPPAPWESDWKAATVTGLGSDYVGTTVAINRRAPSEVSA